MVQALEIPDMLTAIVLIFIIAYAAIALEHPLQPTSAAGGDIGKVEVKSEDPAGSPSRTH